MALKAFKKKTYIRKDMWYEKINIIKMYMYGALITYCVHTVYNAHTFGIFDITSKCDISFNNEDLI